MDELLQHLVKANVNYIKNNHTITLEVLDNKFHQASEIDILINELLKDDTLKSVRLECPEELLNSLICTKEKMQITGKRVMYQSDFATPLSISSQDYEVWSIFESKSIAFLAEVMGKSLQDGEKFLEEMNVELPSQAQRMYTVYRVNNEPVGIVFPHIEPNTNQEGRMFWIGVHSNYLGQGLGKRLHAIGLYRLENEFNAKSYRGITQMENYPMRKIMLENGCLQHKHILVSLHHSNSIK